MSEKAETWRIVLEDGAAREIVVWRDDNGWTTGIEGYAPTARLAVARSATGCCACHVREILAPGEQDSGERAARSMFATWLRDRADDVVNDDPAAAETLYLAERDFRSTLRLDSRRAGETLDLDAMESVARSATANVTDDGYRLRAPAAGGEQGEVIVEYKGSEHPNASNDGALFGHSREYVLSLVAAVRERDSRLAAAVEQARRFVKAYEHNAEYCEKRFGEVSGEWAQEYARKGVACRGVANDMSMVIRIAEGEAK